MKKRILSAVLAGAMLMGVMTTGVFAAEAADTQIAAVQEDAEYDEVFQLETDDTMAEGTIDSISWTITEDGLLTVSGTGEIPAKLALAIYDHKDEITTVTIEEGITNIGRGVFANCASLVTVNLPDSLTSIGDIAFANCPSLEDITLPAALTSLGQGAFMNCSSLDLIKIPEALTDIPAFAFYNCTSLNVIQISAALNSIDEEAFSGCPVMVIWVKNNADYQNLLDSLDSTCSPSILAM